MTKLEVKTFIDAAQIREDTSFSTADLSTPMMQQAALFAHYAHQAARAAKQVDDFKLRLEIVEAKLDKEVRDEAVKAGVKMTEAQIAKEISRKREYVQVQMALNEARMVENLLKGACEALRQKRDMLVQIGVAQREELKGELTIRAAQAGATATSQARRDALSDRIKNLSE